MKNKGFTLVELLTVIVIVGILSLIAVVSVTSLKEKGKMGVYQNYESTLKGAAETYLIENPDKLPTVNNSLKVTINTLVSQSYMKRIEDTEGGSCNSSFVIIKRTADVSNNYNLNYEVCLICDNYVTDKAICKTT